MIILASYGFYASLGFVREKMKSDIPIIIISALGHDDVILKAFELGANAIVFSGCSLAEENKADVPKIEQKMIQLNNEEKFPYLVKNEH